MSDYRAKEVARLLAQDAANVCRYLLPEGKESRFEYTAGSVAGEAGQSLRVSLSGNRAGLWLDHAENGVGGDLLDLWAESRGVSMSDALAQAREYLGIALPKIPVGEDKRPAKLSPPKGSAKASDDQTVIRWLTDTRKLSAESIDAYRVASHKGAVMLPAFSQDGSIQYLKYRSVSEKKFWSERGGVPCLFGWQAIGHTERSVVLCEGELDCLAWHTYGFPALSPTNGANSTDWIDTEYDRLAQFDQIYLSWDMDEPGQSAIKEIIDRLGPERCLSVSLPHKDANECLIKGVSTRDIGSAVASARALDPDELVQAADYADEVVAFYYPTGDEPGVRLPWKKGEAVMLRPGEVSLMAGVNGHGKTQMAGLLTLEAMRQGQRAMVASMEFKPSKWLARLDRQAAAISCPAPEYIHAIHEWYRGRLWAFNAVGTAKSERIIDVAKYGLRRYGIRYFVIDNLAKCGFAEDDYNGQKKFVDQLTDFAREYDVHVQLCLHMRKGESEEKPAGKFDVKGTGAITDMVDTVFALWRNKRKEESRRIAAQCGEAFDETEQPDAVLRCLKQRNGEDEPSVRLWFDREANQFTEHANSKPHRYVDFSSPREVAM